MNEVQLSLDDKARMSFFSHLLELRRRLVISIAAVIVGTILGYIIAPWVIRWIADFYIEASQQRGARLTQTTVLDGFVLRI